jgi:hypothetical protein
MVLASWGKKICIVLLVVAVVLIIAYASIYIFLRVVFDPMVGLAPGGKTCHCTARPGKLRCACKKFMISNGLLCEQCSKPIVPGTLHAH